MSNAELPDSTCLNPLLEPAPCGYPNIVERSCDHEQKGYVAAPRCRSFKKNPLLRSTAILPNLIRRGVFSAWIWTVPS